MREKITTLVLSVILIISHYNVFSQDTSATVVSTDVVSSYVWRGSAGYSPLQGQNILAPSFQPTLAWSKGHFEVGAWGSGDFTGTYKEVDLYIRYTLNNLTFTFTDYYWNLDWLNKNYFDYNSDSTSHILETGLTYKFQKFPLTVQLAVMVYGADKKPTDVTKNNYSTYLEFQYPIPIGKDKLDLVAGMTPSDGYYGDGYGGNKGFAIVNVGLTGYRNIKISNDFKLPLKTSLIANPQQQKMYLVLGITL